jgi:hypothetical protein
MHIIVHEDGTKLTYIDSGPPSSETTYTTIFAVHGMVFSSRSFSNALSALLLIFLSRDLSEGLCDLSRCRHSLRCYKSPRIQELDSIT